MSSINTKNLTDNSCLEPSSLEIGLRKGPNSSIEKGKFLTLSDGSYRFISREGETTITDTHELIVLFKNNITGSRVGRSSFSSEANYAPASIIEEGGKRYITFSKNSDSKVKMPLEKFEYTFKDKVNHALKKRARHLCGAVVLPCAGTALIIQAVAKTALLPLKNPLKLDSNHFSARAIGHDCALGSLLLLKGTKQALQFGAECIILKETNRYKGKSIKESILKSAKKAVFVQSHHHPHMQIVPPLEFFKEGTKRLSRASSALSE